MIIREATADDEAAVVGMALAFLRSSSYAEFEGPPEQLKTLFRALLSIGVVFLAEDGGEPIGMLALAAVPHVLTGQLYGDEVAWWVRPDSRGGPAGLRLLRAAEQWAGQRQLMCLRMVQPADEPAVGRLYQRRGYRVVEVSYHKRW